ncbi:MAG: DNA polymerase III subunit beta [Mycoplasmataceae bacterium]|nr:DNA polymerase III subunit beta [Mycoplasmataceae bacterium]
MKFSAEKKSFIEHLRKVGSISISSSLNPIFQNLMIECAGEEINLYAANEIMSIKTTVNSGITINLTGKCLVNAKMFIGMIEKLSDSSFTVEIIEETVLKITSGKFTTNLNLYNANDFIELDFDENENSNVIPFHFFKQISDKLLKIAPTSKMVDNSPFRGVLLDSTRVDGVLESVATDSYHLVYIKTSFNGNKFKIIIQPELIKIFSMHNKSDKDLQIFIKDNRILVKLENSYYNCSLIEGTYPSAMKVLEAQYDFNFTIERNQAVNAIEKALIVSDSAESAVITLTITANELIISGQDVEKGSSSESLEIVGNVRESIKISLNATNLLNLIRNIASAKVLFNLTSAVKPILVKEENNPNYISLILPIKRN